MADATRQSGYAPVHNGELYYEVEGEGPALVLIHAGVANLRMWDEQVKQFAPHYRVIRYDTRGFGRSRTKDTSFSNRQDLADLMDHLGVERAAVLGLSRGGQIAIDFTVERPERVSALIAVAAGLSGLEGPTPTPELAKLYEEMEAAWEAKDFDRLTAMEVALWCDGPGQAPGRADAKVREQVGQWIAENYRREDGEAQAVVLHPPANPRLDTIRVPTLVIWGDLDEGPVIAAMERLSEGVAGARKVVFPGVAHMVNMERPAEFNQLVLEFLAAAGV